MILTGTNIWTVPMERIYNFRDKVMANPHKPLDIANIPKVKRHLNKFEQKFAEILDLIEIDYRAQSKYFVKQFDFITNDFVIECDGFIHETEGTGTDSFSNSFIPIRYKDAIRKLYLPDNTQFLVTNSSEGFMPHTYSKEDLVNWINESLKLGLNYSESQLNASWKYLQRYKLFRHGSEIGSRLIKHFMICPNITSWKDHQIFYIHWDHNRIFDMLEVTGQYTFPFIEPSSICSALTCYFPEVKHVHCNDRYGAATLAALANGLKVSSENVSNELTQMLNFIGKTIDSTPTVNTELVISCVIKEQDIKECLNTYKHYKKQIIFCKQTNTITIKM